MTRYQVAEWIAEKGEPTRLAIKGGISADLETVTKWAEHNNSIDFGSVRNGGCRLYTVVDADALSISYPIELAICDHRKIKATTQEHASRKYRMGKYNAENETIGGLSATFCDYLDWCDSIEWDVETISGTATVYTNCKGEIEQIKYYSD